MGGAVGGAPTSTGQGGGGFFAAGPAQGGSLGLGGLPMAGPTPAATPVPTAVSTPAPDAAGLQFGTAGTGTAGEPAPIQAAPQAQPQMQQPMYRPQMQQQMPQYQGLQQLLTRMLGNYQQAPRPLAQPQYQNRALAYRPNLAQAQANLGRTATTQAEAQAAAAAKAAENLAQAEEDQGFLNWQRQQYLASKNASYGGG